MSTRDTGTVEVLPCTEYEHYYVRSRRIEGRKAGSRVLVLGQTRMKRERLKDY